MSMSISMSMSMSMSMSISMSISMSMSMSMSTCIYKYLNLQDKGCSTAMTTDQAVRNRCLCVCMSILNENVCVYICVHLYAHVCVNV